MKGLSKKLKKYVGEHKLLYFFVIYFCCNTQPVRAISGTLLI